MLLRFLTTILGSKQEKQPWERGNSELVSVGIRDIVFTPQRVYHSNGFAEESLSAGITDITFVVTKV